MAFSPVPDSATSVTIRPLDKGMHSETSGQDIADGGFVELTGFIGGLEGPRRRPTFSPYAAGQATLYNHRDYVTLWLTGGSQVSLVITEKTLYRINPVTGVTEVPWTYSTGTIKVSNDILVGSGTAWATNDILAGDVVRVTSQEGIVQSVDSATKITLVAAAITNGTGLSYKIQRTFAGGTNPMIDWAVFKNKLLIADGKRPLMAYDPATNTIGYWITNNAKKILPASTAVTSAGTITVSGATVSGSSTNWTSGTVPLPDDTIIVSGYSDTVKTVDNASQITLNHTGLIPTIGSGTAYAITRMVGINMIPNAVGVMNDSATGLNRVWVGYTYDSTDGTQRQRIRWSALADSADFSISTNYIDLPYVWGRCMKLVPLGGTFVAYFDDAIFIGQTTDSTLLPLNFVKIETGGIGLAGVKAVCSYLGGHFYVGTDDIYFLGYGSTKPDRIGVPIVKNTIDLCKSMDKVYATIDPDNYRIVFGFPKSNDYIETIASFDYRSKSWSLSNVHTYAIGNPTVNFSNSWDALSGTWDTLVGSNNTWDGLRFAQQGRYLFIEGNKKIYAQTSGGTLDFSTDPVSATIVTKDHDFDVGDYNKVYVLFGIKIDWTIPPAVPIVFGVLASINKGRSWKSIGSMTVPVGSDEANVSFRWVGSTCRFKLVSTSAVTPYTVSEYTIRARRCGEELSFGDQK